MRHVSARSSADIPVVTESSLESIVTVYAVHFGSAFSVTICGSARRVARSGVMGAHIKPLCFGIVSNVCRDGIGIGAFVFVGVRLRGGTGVCGFCSRLPRRCLGSRSYLV